MFNSKTPIPEEAILDGLEKFSNEHGWNCVSCDENLCIKIVAIADLPSNCGSFKIVGFINNQEGEDDHVAVIKGDLTDGEDILVRIHSECVTGDALSSRRCDCGPQLELALHRIESEGRGIVLYMRQEGRGIGLTNKIRAYALQDLGYDTYEANIKLGFNADERNYEIAVRMLKLLGVKSIRLMTNNPEKVKLVELSGLRVSERIPHQLPAHEDNREYLITKKHRFNHILNLDPNINNEI